VERCQTGLCVCGDESVGALENDSFVAETYDLGIPTTTDKEEIRAFLSKPVLRTADHLHDLPEPLKARRGCTGSRGYFRFRCLGRGSSHVVLRQRPSRPYCGMMQLHPAPPVHDSHRAGATGSER
jgi:hypothetical protein